MKLNCDCHCHRDGSEVKHAEPCCGLSGVRYCRSNGMYDMPIYEAAMKELLSKSKYVYTDDMREISGMGGGYEISCRSMVIAGLEWFDTHPGADPKFHGYQGVYGIICEDNDEAKALSKAMEDACPGGPTGAMVQCTVGHVFNVRSMGWDFYCSKMRALKKEDDAKAEKV